MINNRQTGRRGRGRNGVRPQGNNGGTGRPEQGNRIDNRARGNAAQLLEKYKALARDAQMSGDRVMTEYYLQFADHYFRVLADSRARMDEQRRPQNEPQGANSFQDDDYADDGEGDITDSFDDPRPDQPRYNDRPREQAYQRGQDGQRQDNQRQDGQRQDGQRPDNQRQDRGDRQQADGNGDRQSYQDRAPRGDRQQADGGQNDRAPRQDRGGQDRQDRPRMRDQNDGQREAQRDGQRNERPDRFARTARDDGQERGNEGQTYRTIRADAPADRGPVASPLAPPPQAVPPAAAVERPAPDAAPSADETRMEAPRRTRTRRPADTAPVADAPRTEPAAPAEPELALAPVDASPAATPPADMTGADAAPVEAPRRRGRPRTVTAAPADDDRIDRLALPPALSTATAESDAPSAEDKPRRRRRPRAEGDVAA